MIETTTRRFQCSAARARAWAASLADPSAPHLHPERRAGALTLIWSGYTGPHTTASFRAFEIAQSEGPLDPKLTYCDVEVDRDALAPLARWLAEQRLACRYEASGSDDTIEVVEATTVTAAPWVQTMYGVDATPQHTRRTLLWAPIGDAESGEACLERHALGLIGHGELRVERVVRGQVVASYDITVADRAWAAAHPRTLRQQERVVRDAADADLLASRRADDTLVEERDLARECQAHVGRLHILRKRGLLMAAATGPAPCVWYRRSDLPADLRGLVREETKHA